MSQAFFTKLDAKEKSNRLTQLVLGNGSITVWAKKSKDKHTAKVINFDPDFYKLTIKLSHEIFKGDNELLVSFEVKGVSFFSQVKLIKKDEITFLDFYSDLFKSERRTSFRLLTYPVFEIWLEVDLGERYQGKNVIDLNTKMSQTKIFQAFAKMADGDKKAEDNLSKVKIRIQDLSATGLSLFVSDLELKYFETDKIYQDVKIYFPDEVIEIPQLKIIYVVDFLSAQKKLKKYKIGCQFEKLPPNTDHLLGKKINSLLREDESNKDFENFIK